MHIAKVSERRLRLWYACFSIRKVEPGRYMMKTRIPNLAAGMWDEDKETTYLIKVYKDYN